MSMIIGIGIKHRLWSQGRFHVSAALLSQGDLNQVTRASNYLINQCWTSFSQIFHWFKNYRLWSMPGIPARASIKKWAHLLHLHVYPPQGLQFFSLWFVSHPWWHFHDYEGLGRMCYSSLYSECTDIHRHLRYIPKLYIVVSQEESIIRYSVDPLVQSMSARLLLALRVSVQ